MEEKGESSRQNTCIQLTMGYNFDVFKTLLKNWTLG